MLRLPIAAAPLSLFVSRTGKGQPGTAAHCIAMETVAAITPKLIHNIDPQRPGHGAFRWRPWAASVHRYKMY